MFLFLLQLQPTLVWVISIAGILAFSALFLYYVPVNLWITAIFSGVSLSIGQLIGMRLRQVPPNLIVRELIKAKKAGLPDVNVNRLETHYLANGNVNKVVDALVAARNADIRLDFTQAAAIDLAGRDVLMAVRDSVNTKVIDSPRIEAMARDGIQLYVKARITVRAQIDKLVGGAGEETVVARVGQGIVGAIGSSDSHKTVLKNPKMISEKIMTDGLTHGTAYEVRSIDIADIDVGKNIGAVLRAETAEADLKYAQAKAEEKRAEAVAEEQVHRAEVEKMRAKLVEAESQVPLALSDAFRMGNIGVMDFYKMQNIDADTRMRRAFSEIDDEEEDRPNRKERERKKSAPSPSSSDE